MQRFLKAAFKITLFQTFIILFFSALKYVLNTYQFEDEIQKPFIWLCAGASILFILARSIIGAIENRFESYEDWGAKTQKTRIEKFMAAFVTLGHIIPAAFAYALFLYIIAPTSWWLFVALYAGIVISNIIRFFSKRQTEISQEPN